MAISLRLPRVPLLQQLTGGNGSGSDPLLMKLPEVPIVILPPHLTAICVGSAVLGAFARVLQENRRGQRSSRANWNTFGICAIFGVPLAWALSEWLFRTQLWARTSSGTFCVLAVVIGSNGQGLAMEMSDGVTTAAREILSVAIAKGKQLTQAIFAPISPKDEDKKP